MDRRFTSLRVIGTILKILGWLALILGVLGGIGALVAGFVTNAGLESLGINYGGPLAGVAAFFVAVIAAVIYFLVFYSAGEWIYLMLSVEENTRRTALLMQQQFMPQEQLYSPPEVPPGYQDR
jgi:hypothetical protein